MFEGVKNILYKTIAINNDEIMQAIFSRFDVQSKIIELNTIEQLYNKGQKADENYLPAYSPTTALFYKPIAFSEGRDGRTENMTLKDYGYFYESFRVTAEQTQAVITANTKVGNTDLEIRYPNIIGLTTESINKLNEIIKPLFLEAYKQKMVS